MKNVYLYKVVFSVGFDLISQFVSIININNLL